MATASITNAIRIGTKAKLFLVPAPATYSGDAKAIALAVTDLIYTTAGKKSGSTKVQPWGNADENGWQLKVTTNTQEADTQLGSKRIVGVESVDVEFSGNIYDFDIDHLSDIFSKAAGDQIATAAAAGEAGRTALGVGSEAYLTDYAICMQLPSKEFAGAFDHIILPATNLVAKQDNKISKKEKLALKVEGKAYLRAEINHILVYDFATEAAV